MKKTVAIIATLDTKGEEVKYINDQFKLKGLNVFIIDTSILKEPIGIKPDISSDIIAEKAGTSIEVLRKEYRAPAVVEMAKGVPIVVKELFENKRFDGMLCISGQTGAHMGAPAMEVLPVGVPKLMVSPIFSGRHTFGDYVGTNDVLLMHSVTDILGVNVLSRKVFDTAIAAMTGMVNEGITTEIKADNLVAITMLGNTTPAVMVAKDIIEKNGYECVVFHPSGTGGQAMEEYIERGVFKGVLDMTTHDVADEIYGGLCAGGPNRLEAAGKAGISQLFVPGCVDFISAGALDTIPEKYKNRKIYPHSPSATIIRTTKEELQKVAETVSSKLNKANGPTVVVVPLRGLSMYNKEGYPMYDPEVDREFLNNLKEKLNPSIKFYEIDAHINDPIFAEKVASIFLDLLEKV